jgi:hypothetical protein
MSTPASEGGYPVVVCPIGLLVLLFRPDEDCVDIGANVRAPPEFTYDTINFLHFQTVEFHYRRVERFGVLD